MPKKIGYVNYRYTTYKVYQPTRLYRDMGPMGRGEYYNPAYYSGVSTQSIFDPTRQSNFEQMIQGANELIGIYDSLKQYNSIDRNSSLLDSGNLQDYQRSFNADVDAFNALRDKYLKTRTKIYTDLSYGQPIYSRSHDPIYEQPSSGPRISRQGAADQTTRSFNEGLKRINETINIARANDSELGALFNSVSQVLNERKDRLEKAHDKNVKLAEERAANEREAKRLRDDQAFKRAQERKDAEALSIQKENTRSIKALEANQKTVMKTLNAIQKQMGPVGVNFSRPISSIFTRSVGGDDDNNNIINDEDEPSIFAQLEDLNKRQTNLELKSNLQKPLNINDVTNIVKAELSQLHQTNIPANVSSFQNSKLDKSKASELSFMSSKHNQSAPVDNNSAASEYLSSRGIGGGGRLAEMQRRKKAREQENLANKSALLPNVNNTNFDNRINNLEKSVSILQEDKKANKSALTEAHKQTNQLANKIDSIGTKLKEQGDFLNKTFSATKPILGMQEKLNKQDDSIKTLARIEQDRSVKLDRIGIEAAGNTRGINTLRNDLSQQRRDVIAANARSKLNASAIEVLNKKTGSIQENLRDNNQRIAQLFEANREDRGDALRFVTGGIKRDVNALHEDLNNHKRTTALEQQQLRDQLTSEMAEGLKGVKVYNNIKYRELYNAFSNDKAMPHRHGTRAVHARRKGIFDTVKRNLFLDFAIPYMKNVV